MDSVELFTDLVAEQVDLFDAIDSRLRAETDLLLIALLPMRVIARTSGCRIQDIADRVRISAGGASKSADRLERDGLAMRLPNPVDRRSTIIELTPRGREVLCEGERIIAAETGRRVADVLDADELAAFAGTLRKLRDLAPRPS